MSKSKDVYCHCLTFSVFFVFCFCFSLLPMYFLCFSLCHSLLYASLHVLNKVFFYFSFLSSARLKYNFKFKNIFFLRKRCFGKFLDLQMKGRIMKSCWVSYLVFIIECIENSSIVSTVNYWYNITVRTSGFNDRAYLLDFGKIRWAFFHRILYSETSL